MMSETSAEKTWNAGCHSHAWAQSSPRDSFTYTYRAYVGITEKQDSIGTVTGAPTHGLPMWLKLLPVG